MEINQRFYQRKIADNKRPTNIFLLNRNAFTDSHGYLDYVKELDDRRQRIGNVDV